MLLFVFVVLALLAFAGVEMFRHKRVMAEINDLRSDLIAHAAAHAEALHARIVTLEIEAHADAKAIHDRVKTIENAATGDKES